MRIESLRSEKKGTKARVAATVLWEDCNHPSQEIYFEVDEIFSQDLSCNPHAFLLACLFPAMRHGEKRIAIQEVICPELRTGLLTAMGWICQWFGPPRKPVQIEAKKGICPPLACAKEYAGAFLSGGIDSLAMLRANRLDFPLDHPRAIKDCLFVHGFDIGGADGADGEIETFERAVSSLSKVVKDTQAILIPVSTNIRQLDNDVHFWIYEFHGAALSSIAHALSPRLTSVSIASGFDIPNIIPAATHPLIDPNYSSTALRIRHEGILFSRLEKVGLLADWDVALQNLRVCTMNPPGLLNCGKCEKCIRSMTELLAVGKLASAGVFPQDDVSEEMLSSITITEAYQQHMYRELIDPLRGRDRLDLVGVIEKKLMEFDKYLAWGEERDWKGVIKRFDRRYLRRNLFKVYKAFREHSRG